MAITAMKKLSVVLAKQDRLSVLNYLQETGVTVIDENKDLAHQLELRGLLAEYQEDRRSLQDKEVYAGRMSRIRKPLEDYNSIDFSVTAIEDLIQTSITWQNRIKSALSTLREYSTEKKPLFSQKRKRTLDERYMEEETQIQLLAQIEELERVKNLEREIQQDLAAEISHRNALEDWKDLNLPTEISNGKFQSESGYFLSEESYLDFVKQVEETDVPLVSEVYFQREDFLAVLMAWPHDFEQDARKLIQASDKQSFLSSNALEKDGNFRQSYEDSVRKIETLEKQLETTKTSYLELKEYIPEFEFLHDVIEADKSKLEALLALNNSDYVSVLSGYIPEKNASQVAEVLATRFNSYVLLEEPVEEEDLPPTLLENRSLFSPIESTIETFSSPHYFADLDPSWIMMITYGFFFGSMLSDVGYGGLLAIGCALGIWKFNAQGNMRNMLKVFMTGGIFAVFFGILYGSLFGGMFGTLTNGAFDLPVVWFNPMDDPINLMIWSMVFGAVHLFISMGLDIKNKIRRGNWYDAAFSVAPWYLIIIGLGLMLIGVRLGVYLAIGGVAVIILMRSKERNPIKRIFGGLGGLMDVTAWLSDLLSYTRILALTLATSVIAMVVNLMAGMIGTGGVQIIFTILVLIAGHALNLALSTLSAYVHATRLHYVEFFGKFYEGGGRPYAPLRMEGQYTQVVNENPLSPLTDKARE